MCKWIYNSKNHDSFFVSGYTGDKLTNKPDVAKAQTFSVSLLLLPCLEIETATGTV